MLIPLVCTQCGGKLEVDQSQVIESDRTFIVLSGQTLSCPQCGTKYLPGEQVKHFPEKVAVSAGGTFIGGSITASTIIMGDKIIINENAHHPYLKDSKEQRGKMEKFPKENKKWWQFWKH